MTQHTPGPWEIVSDAETLEFTVLSRDAIVGREICTLQFHDERSVGAKEANERQEANARLIAAAPKLLAFVQSLARMLPYCYEEGCKKKGLHTHGGVTPDGSWTDDQAEDALTTVNALINEAREISKEEGL